MDHEKLIDQILEEEESLITNHRGHIDEAVGIVKEEMTLLNGVDKAGSDVERYALDLDKVLLAKIMKISKMRDQLHLFYKHLKTEENMGRLYSD
jgi:kinesin family protein 2/24